MSIACVCTELITIFTVTFNLQGVTCVCDDAVMEVVWGMKNLMPTVVPQERKMLTKEERLPMSKGVQTLLRRYSFDVKPEMVLQFCSHLILIACCTFFFWRTDFLPLRKGTQYNPNYSKDLEKNRNYKQLTEGPICKVRLFPILLRCRRRNLPPRAPRKANSCRSRKLRRPQTPLDRL